MLLACGGPYSGVTTSMFGLLRSIDVYMYSIYTIGDMQGRSLHNIRPFESREEDDLSDTIQRAARAEADVICIEPLKKGDRLQQAFEMQSKVCLVAEFPARDAATGVLQLIKWTGDREKVATGVSAILSQKLIRVLCAECREAYPPNRKLLERVGLPPETKVLYRPPRPPADPDQDPDYEPCRHCGGVGYYGRAGLYELIEMTEAMQKLVTQSGTEAGNIRALARKEGMITLQKCGLQMVAEGRTSLEELQRTFKG